MLSLHCETLCQSLLFTPLTLHQIVNGKFSESEPSPFFLGPLRFLGLVCFQIFWGHTPFTSVLCQRVTLSPPCRRPWGAWGARPANSRPRPPPRLSSCRSVSSPPHPDPSPHPPSPVTPLLSRSPPSPPANLNHHQSADRRLPAFPTKQSGRGESEFEAWNSLSHTVQ